MEKGVINVDHIRELFQNKQFKETVAYIVDKFIESRTGSTSFLTQKGRIEVASNMIESILSNDPSLDNSEENATIILIGIAKVDEESFMNLIRSAFICIAAKGLKEGL